MIDNKKIKILAIDDNRDNLITIKALIGEIYPEVRVITASSGKEGLELALVENPDIILLDIVMQGMDGFEICENLKADKILCDVPVIFITDNKVDKKSRIRALEVGADAFLAKPIDESELKAQIKAMLKIKMANFEKSNENIRLKALIEEHTSELRRTNSATLNLLEDLKTENEARKKTEEALHKSEELYRSVIHASPDNITVTDLKGDILMISPRGLNLFGYETIDQIAGRNINEFLVAEHRDRAASNINQMFQGVFNGPEDYTIIKADGSIIDTEINAEFVRDIKGVPTGLVFAIRDISERKIAQDAIRKSEEKLEDNRALLNKLLFESTEFIDYNLHIIGYKKMLDVVTEISGAKFGSFNMLNQNQTDFRTVALSGIDNLQQSIKTIMGFDLIGKEWKYDSIKESKTKHTIITKFNSLAELTGSVLPNSLVNLVSKMFNIGEIWIIRIINKDTVIGDFTLLFTQGTTLQNPEILELYAKQVAMFVERLRAEEALRESEEKYRLLVENSPNGIAIYQNGKFVYINKTGLKILGTDNESNLIGKSILSFVHPDSMAEVIERVSQITAGSQVSSLEEKLIRFDGSVFDAEVTALVTAFNGKTAGQIIVRDITERKSAVVKLEESEAKYREFVENSPEAIAIYSDGVVSYVNKECVRLMKATTKDQLIGMSVIEFIHPDNRQIVIERMMKVAVSEVNVSLPVVEEKYIRLDGTPIYVEVKVMPLIIDGKPAFQLTARDITDRKMIESALEKSRTELKTIYDYAPVMMCVVDENRRIQFANNAFKTLVGEYKEGMVGAQVGGAIGCTHSLDDPRGCGFGLNCTNCTLRIAMDKTFSTGVGLQNVEYQSTLNIDGKSRDVSLLGSTAIIQTSEQRSLLLYLHDITDRKIAEQALQKSETLLRTFIDNSPFEIWARDNENVGILENKKQIEHYGSIIGYTPHSDPKIDREILQLWERNNSRAFTGEIIDEEYEFIVKGEPRIFQQIIFSINENAKIIGIAGFNIDITDRKLAEEKMYENSIKLEMAMQVANMAWWELNIKTGNVIFGKRKTDMIGFPSENFVHYSDFMNLIHAEDHEKTMEAMRNHINGLTDKYEIEYRIQTSTGEYKWFYDIGSISKRDYDGNPLVVSGSVLDITERKNFERELANQKQLFEQLFMQSPLSSQILNRDGWCERVNPKLAKLFRVEAKNNEEYVYNIFDNEEIKRNGIVAKLKKVFEEGEKIEWEMFFDISVAADLQNAEIKQNRKSWYSNWAYPIKDQNGEINHVIIQHTDITDKKLSEQALKESQEQLKKFAAHLQNVREEERVLLAREIHDQLGQILIAVKIDIGMLKQTVLKNIDKRRSDELLVKFDNLSILVDNTIKTARKIMTDLRPEVLDMIGFIETVRQHLTNFQERYKVTCNLVTSDSHLELSTQQSVALFRVIQEALNNIAKHAKATEANVIINKHNKILMLEIADNGVGFDHNQKINHDSYGLIGMRERVFLLDGELSIKSSVGKGTSVQVIMPLDGK